MKYDHLTIILSSNISYSNMTLIWNSTLQKLDLDIKYALFKNDSGMKIVLFKHDFDRL